MKKLKDIMHVKERRDRFGNLSLILHCSGKDKITLKNKVYVKTFRVPSELKGVKEIEAFRMKCQTEWKDEVLQISRGLVNKKKQNIKFRDFAREWVENILVRSSDSYSYYTGSLERLKVLEERLSGYYIHEMNQIIIQDFCYWLCSRTFTRKTATVTTSILPLIKERRISQRKVSEGSGIAPDTLRMASRVGGNVSYETACKVCEFLGIEINKYFFIQTTTSPYSYDSNHGVKRLLHSILQSAVRQGLVERNYASKEFIEPLTGKRRKRPILEDKNDIIEFVRRVETEKDQRKKIAFSILINLGIRSSELVGLEWRDINFFKSELSINRNTLYVGKELGIITKDPKTETSKRTITIPSKLLFLLREYKTWWDKEKINHGDLWAFTDRLFVQTNGKNMVGSTIYHWLTDFQKEHGLKKVTPHGLRHTNITFQIANGVDVKTVQGRAGHSKVTTTLDIYSRYTKEGDRQAANVIDELLKVN